MNDSLLKDLIGVPDTQKMSGNCERKRYFLTLRLLILILILNTKVVRRWTLRFVEKILLMII